MISIGNPGSQDSPTLQARIFKGSWKVFGLYMPSHIGDGFPIVWAEVAITPVVTVSTSSNNCTGYIGIKVFNFGEGCHI